MLDCPQNLFVVLNESHQCMDNPIHTYKNDTRALALTLHPSSIYDWMLDVGYFPERYVLPPCFCVTSRPAFGAEHFSVKKDGTVGNNQAKSECESISIPKSRYTDRKFSFIEPRLYSDASFVIASNWPKFLRRLIPKCSLVTSYSLPIPLDRENPGTIGRRRGGKLIYQFLDMLDEDIASVAYRYPLIVRSDIRNFYSSIYTHSIAWAVHGERFIRGGNKIQKSCTYVGNRLDRLVQLANGGRTNGIPVGPALSDLIAELIAVAIDAMFSKLLRTTDIECEAVRFKDDYRILVKSHADGQRVIKLLQQAVNTYHLDLADEKTSIHDVPANLFREWYTRYMAVHPGNEALGTWKGFWTLYLNVLRIERDIPGSGMIDRFLADIVGRDEQLRLNTTGERGTRIISLLLALRELRPESFPKILAIIESIYLSSGDCNQKRQIVDTLCSLLENLKHDEKKNEHPIAWICYFLVSQGMTAPVSPFRQSDSSIVRSIATNSQVCFQKSTEYVLFENCVDTSHRTSLLRHIDLFERHEAT
jgi:hypothetical protein